MESFRRFPATSSRPSSYANWSSKEHACRAACTLEPRAPFPWSSISQQWTGKVIRQVSLDQLGSKNALTSCSCFYCASLKKVAANNRYFRCNHFANLAGPPEVSLFRTTWDSEFLEERWKSTTLLCFDVQQRLQIWVQSSWKLNGNIFTRHQRLLTFSAYMTHSNSLTKKRD